MVPPGFAAGDRSHAFSNAGGDPLEFLVIVPK